VPVWSSASLWRNPDLVRILIGETVSDLGSQVGSLALPLAAALTLQATPGQMAILGIAEYVPPILLGLIAGVWIDRVRRRPLLMGANLARALVLAALALASAAHVLRVDVLYAASVALGALNVMFTTAFAAFLPSLVVPSRSAPSRRTSSIEL